MRLVIFRGPSTDEGTFSTAILDDGGPSFSWLELPERGNTPGKSRIPTGTYRAYVRFSPHFECEVYALSGVPNRTNIEIHPGNWAGDASLGWYSDLMGCMSPGHGFTIISPPEPGAKMQRAVKGSRAAFQELMTRTGGAPLDIEIREESMA